MGMRVTTAGAYVRGGRDQCGSRARRPEVTFLPYGELVAHSRRLRALITNDDGIDSPGLLALATGARDAGFEVVVAAPHTDASGVGGSVLSVRDGNRTRLHRRELADLPGVPAYAVEGHPAFIVHSAGRGWLDPEPDVVLSGINLGANLGHAVLHSGTVNAVLTGSMHGWRGLAVSLDIPERTPEHPHWETVLHLLPDVLDVLLAAPDGTALTLNVPDLPVAEIGELREARLSTFGAVRVRVDHRAGEHGEALHSEVTEMSTPLEPGRDAALLAAGHPTLTELVGVTDRPGVLDRTMPNRRAG
jgi:5'-nucleotidase